MFTAEESPNVARRKDAAGRVNDRARDNYMFMYHPAEWAVDFRGKLMPQVMHMSKGIGCGAVDAQTGDFTPALVEYQRRGFVPIPHEVLGEDDDYVAPYRNKKGQLVCRSIFQTPHQSSPEEPTNWEFDQEAWDAFIDYLRQQELIKPPRPEVLRRLLSIQEQLLATKKSPRTDDGAALDRHNAKVARIGTSIETLKAEIEIAVKFYGRAASPGRRRVLAKLMAARVVADSEGLEDLKTAAPPKPKAKRPRKPQAATKAATKAAPPEPTVPPATEAPAAPVDLATDTGGPPPQPTAESPTVPEDTDTDDSDTPPPESTADGADGFVADDDGAA